MTLINAVDTNLFKDSQLKPNKVENLSETRVPNNISSNKLFCIKMKLYFL